MATKVTQLTGSNVHALQQAVQVGMDVEHIGATVAIFPGSAADALKSLADAREVLYRQHGGRGHPVQSLAAVRRKLERQL
ncbi:hypothetical protein FDJ13_gp50 [Gordonia phage Gustav]|uniref:Uncharacterized protein n=1 Tax=Gordonia phage Gustav TaxID=2047872 RepID=A0A2H4PAA4_9CAUD|nr:hypothetical protein FDJ13_gp50 [Gordonia phage Gustav]ATW59110.1 hypothetical protein PHIRE_GUSTAV_50 [Gordonia phage Gustav]